MDRLHLINVFVSVVDANGFAGAARKLNISPPAVTRAISELEAHLGVRLLTRTTRVVRVTEAGARYVEDCRRILAELAEADESVSGLHAAPRGRLTLTAPALFGALFVTPIVTEYLQRYPEVTASCWFLDRVVNMVDEGVDIGVRIGELPDSSLQAIRVGRVRRVICAAPSYLKRHGAPQTPDDLTAHTIVSASGVTPHAGMAFGGKRRTKARQAAAAHDHHHERLGGCRSCRGIRADPADVLSGGRARARRSAPTRAERVLKRPLCPCIWCTARAAMPHKRRALSWIWRSSVCAPARRWTENGPAGEEAHAAEGSGQRLGSEILVGAC